LFTLWWVDHAEIAACQANVLGIYCRVTHAPSLPLQEYRTMASVVALSAKLTGIKAKQAALKAQAATVKADLAVAKDAAKAKKASKK